MNFENKRSKTMIISIFIAGIVLLIAVAFFNFMDSPKTFIPNYYNEYIKEEEEIFDDYLSEISSENESSESPFPIMINTATSEELQMIPDIGPVTAELIINYRNEAGTILSFDELIVIDGIGEKTVELLKKYCKIN